MAARRRIDDVDVAVAVVGHVVVEHDESPVVAGRLGLRSQLDEAVERPAVEGHQRAGCTGEVGRLGGQVEAGEEVVVRGHHERLRPRRRRGQALGPGQVVQGEHRPEGIAVGADVADEIDRPRTGDELGRTLQLVAPFRLRPTRGGLGPRDAPDFPGPSAAVVHTVLLPWSPLQIAQDLLDPLPR